ncbi:MAG: glycine cleavage system aminomethyltransferase GcvT [Cyanobacteriota bacterium]
MNNENLKRTALYEKHLKLKAKIVPFAGWEMPLQYDKITAEHITVREQAGLFDVSHMGEFKITGKASLNLLQRLVPQDISKMEEGKAVYTQFCNPTGGIIDDLIIYRLNDKNNTYNFLLIVNASNIEKDFNWIITNQNDTSEITVKNISDDYSLMALQGPNAVDILDILGIDIDNQPKRFRLKETQINNIECIVARTGYTGEDGFEILVNNNQAAMLWDSILKAGETKGLKPIGLAARDTLRLEAALPLHGNDIDENTTPIEAGLKWSVCIDKPDFIGKEVLIKQLQQGTDKIFIGFKMQSSRIPRQGCEIFQGGRIIGSTTSGSIAPYLNYPIGMGYVDKTSNTKTGDLIEVLIRDKKYPAEIVKRPFYKMKKR